MIRLLPILFALALCAQTPPSALHEKTVHLVNSMGFRERLQSSLPSSLEQGKAAMRKQCPECADQFIDEWGKRMAARTKVDEWIAVAVRAYEKRFTLPKITELQTVVDSAKAGKPAAAKP